jgi:hypothetical protein
MSLWSLSRARVRALEMRMDLETAGATGDWRLLPYVVASCVDRI